MIALHRANTEFLRTQPNASKLISKPDEITFTVNLVLHSDAARAFARHQAMAELCHDLIGPDARPLDDAGGVPVPR